MAAPSNTRIDPVKWIPALLSAGLASAAFAAALAAKAPLPSAQVRQASLFKRPVLIHGTVTKQVSLDSFVLSDGTGEILIDVRGVRHHLKAGDSLVARGRSIRKGEFEVADFVSKED